MKNFGKILAFVVVLSMLFTLVAFGEEAATPTATPAPAATETPVATAAPATNGSFSDVKDTDSAFEAITALCGLGVITGYPDGTFGPDKSITRAEFSAVVDRVKALGDSADAAKGATMFTDVAGDHWASGYINLASQQGIVNGMGDGTFAPDANVTFAQAVKMVVSALGYEPQAKSLGGWPSGYLAVAAQKGVTKGVASSKESEPATRATVAKMLYNALDIPMMEQTGFGTDVAFEAGDKLLLDGLDVVKVEGTVTESGFSGDSETPSLDNDEVKFQVVKEYVAIDGILKTVDSTSDYYDLDTDNQGKLVVLTGKTNAKDLLQYSAIAYIKNADDDAEFAAITPKTGKNTTITIKGSDIKDDTETPSQAADWDLEYYTDKDNDKDDTVTIKDSATYYYNGSEINNARPFSNTKRAVFDIVKDAIKTSGDLEGYVTLLNNDTDDLYDVVYVTEYKDFIVDEVNAKSYKVTGDIIDLSASVIFDLEDKDADFTFEKDGKPAKFEDIKADDVISLAGYINNDKEFLFGKVIIATNKISGKVNESNTDDSEVTIGDKTYEYTSWVADNQDSKIEAGDEGVFYVNANGKICAVDTEKAVDGSVKLAYVTKIATSGSISSSVQVRLLTIAGEWKTLDMASKVTIKDNIADATDETSTVVTVDQVSDWRTYATGATISTTDADTYLINRVISYDVNSDGKINKIDFIPDSTSSQDDSSFFATTQSTDNYDENGNELTNNVYVNDSTVIVDLPETAPSPSTGYAEDDISVVKSDILLDNAEYKFRAYNLNDDNEAVLVVGTGFTGKINYANDFMIIDTKASALNADSEDVTKITGYVKGEKVELVIATDADYDAVDLVNSVVTASGVNDDANVVMTAADEDDSDLEKGTVILFTKNGKGEINKLLILFNSSDAALSTGTIRPATMKAAVELFTKNSGGDDNKFVFGYAYEKASSRYTFVKDDITNGTNGTILSFATGASVYTYDEYYSSNGRIQITDAGDIDTDSSGQEMYDHDNNVATPMIVNPVQSIEGDYVFAHVNDSGKIQNAVIISCKD